MVTVLTRTIGPSGRDYASFTLAEADVTNIGTSADLVANDEAIVFEADAGTYNEHVSYSSSLVTDATRQVTYKPATGSEHGGVPGGGVVINSTASLNSLRDDYMIFDGMEVNGSSSQVFNIQVVTGATLRNCILDAAVQNLVIGSGAVDLTVENCVLSSGNYTIYPIGSSGTVSVSVRNCTVTQGPAILQAIRIAQSGTATINAEFVNCLFLEGAGGVYNATGAVTVTGSNNFGGATNPFPVALQGSPYPITPTTSFSTPLGSGDYAVYMGATGALADVTGNDVWQQGVGPASNSDVPTTDINGVTRSGTSCNPGAFEADGFVAPTVLTRTIGSGKDYSTFTLAEAAVTSIGSGTDLTFYNEAIVFEADAGTYTGGTQINSTLVTDPTRNVTYTVAAGSEHGGDPASGVIIETSGSAGTAGIWVYDSHTIFDGLNLKTTVGQDSKGWRFQDVASASTVIRNCIFVGSSSGSLGSDAIYALYHGYSAVPTVVENCRLSGQCFFRTTSTDGNWRFVNNTLIKDSAQPTVEFRGINSSVATGTTMTVKVTNNWGNCTRSGYFAGAGTTNLTGSNNYGEGTGTYDFPAAIRGTPYPITATTDTSPGAGDWAIYQASNGQLYNIVANDVWQQGVGPTANSDVPATDILGVARYGATANPGAFELGLPVPGIRVKPRHFQVNTAATAHAVSVWQPQLRKL